MMTDRTDEETVELIREWLQQYGLTVIVGIVLGIAAIGGYRWWENRKTEDRYQQSAQLETIRDAVRTKQFANAEKTYQLLQQQHGDIAGLASLVMAAGYEVQGKNNQAEQALQNAATDGDDTLAQQTARWQKALLAVRNAQYEQAEKLLATLRDSAYSAQTFALQGYIFQKQGKQKEAVQAYKSSQDLLPDFTVTEQLNAATAALITGGK